MWAKRIGRTPLQRLEAESLILQKAIDAAAAQHTFKLCGKLCEYTRSVFAAQHDLVMLDPRLAKSKQLIVEQQFDVALACIHAIQFGDALNEHEKPHVEGMISNMTSRIKGLKVLGSPIPLYDKIAQLEAIGEEMVENQAVIQARAVPAH